MTLEFELVDALEVDAHRAGQLIWDFVVAHSISVLNVAGPRASKQPRAHEYSHSAIGSALRIGASS